MAWSFQSYDKIPEHARRWSAQAADQRRLESTAWVVTEKVHGANLCFVVDAEGVHVAKRRALLAPGEDFFGHRAVLSRLGEPLRALRRERTSGAVARVLVYGELFGGAYPHPDVPPVPGVQAIQTGVWYCPEIDFLAVDVVEEDESGENRRWLGWDELVARCTAAAVPFLPARFIGSYAEARQQPVAFPTEIPLRRGLPPLADNLAEGFVLKPRVPFLIEGQRPCIKHKHPRFQEDDRYHQATHWPATRTPTAQPGTALDILEFAMLGKLNEARYASSRSKLGPSAPMDALHAELVSDVWAELLDEQADTIASLLGEERLLLQSALSDEAHHLIRNLKP